MDTITISRIRIDVPSSHTTKTTLRQQAPALPTFEASAGPMRGRISSRTASLGCSWIAFDRAGKAPPVVGRYFNSPTVLRLPLCSSWRLPDAAIGESAHPSAAAGMAALSCVKTAGILSSASGLILALGSAKGGAQRFCLWRLLFVHHICSSLTPS